MIMSNDPTGPQPRPADELAAAIAGSGNRCATCHRDAHRPGSENHGHHGHPYQAPAIAGPPTRVRITCGQVRITPGQFTRLRLPYSEVCLSMHVAGHVMTVELTDTPYPMAQLHWEGREFSAPILPSEAGIYGNSRDGFYAYVSEGK